MSERTVDAGRAIAHWIDAPIDRWTESDALDPMFEKPQKAQVVRIKIETISPDSTSIAPSFDGPLLGQLRTYEAIVQVAAQRTKRTSAFFPVFAAGIRLWRPGHVHTRTGLNACKFLIVGIRS
jgi:hypothetical protein